MREKSSGRTAKDKQRIEILAWRQSSEGARSAMAAPSCYILHVLTKRRKCLGLDNFFP